MVAFEPDFKGTSLLAIQLESYMHGVDTGGGRAAL